MLIQNAKFIVSAADKKGFLKPEKPMIAVCGKSNVGKSSFINMLAGQKRLARTSAEPGRTRLINYFDFGLLLIADLPGYGFARVPKAEKDKWARLMDDFFSEGGVTHVLALADIRHDPTEDDKTMIGYLYATQTPFTIIATKADKLAKTRIHEAVRKIAAVLKTGEGNIIATSAQTQFGKERVLAEMEAVCERFAFSQKEEFIE